MQRYRLFLLQGDKKSRLHADWRRRPAPPAHHPHPGQRFSLKHYKQKRLSYKLVIPDSRCRVRSLYMAAESTLLSVHARNSFGPRAERNPSTGAIGLACRENPPANIYYANSLETSIWQRYSTYLARRPELPLPSDSNHATKVKATVRIYENSQQTASKNTKGNDWRQRFFPFLNENRKIFRKKSGQSCKKHFLCKKLPCRKSFKNHE